MRVVGSAAALLLALTLLSMALAHTQPVKVVPGDGAVLNVAPTEVVMEMSQPMANQAGANDIDVLDDSGREVTTTAAVMDSTRRILTVQLPGLATGEYAVRWKSVSDDDGDEASGQTTFRYDPRATPSPGRENLRDAPAVAPTRDESTAPSLGESGSTGSSWVAWAAAAVAVLAVGIGIGFLLSRRSR